MNLPNKITIARIIMSPVFFVLFFLPEWTGMFKAVSVLVLWAVFIASEISDLMDGYIARKYNLVGDLGKVLDPFADVISRMTYFVCFTGAGIMPIWVLMVILYREFGVSFIRMMVSKQGVALAARMTGKLKAWLYAIGGILGLLYVSMDRLNAGGWLRIPDTVMGVFDIIVLSGFIIAGVGAVLSFTDYLLHYIRTFGKHAGKP